MAIRLKAEGNEVIIVGLLAVFTDDERVLVRVLAQDGEGIDERGVYVSELEADGPTEIAEALKVAKH
jgi:hypothetical protein